MGKRAGSNLVRLSDGCLEKDSRFLIVMMLDNIVLLNLQASTYL
jgi:hypothetical protein